jgi:hypothetical protein
VADAEKQMHALAGNSPVMARNTAWKEALRPWQGLAIERIALRHLLARGYDLWYTPQFSRPMRWKHATTAWVNYCLRNATHTIRAAGWYSGNLRLLRHRLKFAFGTRMAVNDKSRVA